MVSILLPLLGLFGAVLGAPTMDLFDPIPDEYLEESLDGYMLPPDFLSDIKYELETVLDGILSTQEPEVSVENDKFRVVMNMTDFKLEDIEVKYIEGMLFFEAVDEKASDEENSKRFILYVDENVDVDKFTGSLSADGTLTIQAPLLKSGETVNREVEKEIEIKSTSAAVEVISTTTEVVTEPPSTTTSTTTTGSDASHNDKI